MMSDIIFDIYLFNLDGGGGLASLSLTWSEYLRMNHWAFSDTTNWEGEPEEIHFHTEVKPFK